MRVMVVGSGAREHALAWKLRQSPLVDALFVAPGNAGTAALATNLPIPASDIAALADVALRHGIDLTVVGPEDPLARGLVDHFQDRGLVVAGPTAAAARIESSKAWAKEIMTAAGVPTAASRTYVDLDAALAAVRRGEPPIVVKADGLAAGKGVVVAATHAEAEAAVRDMLGAGTLGEAGRCVLLEECLTGQEVSLLAMTDGETIYPLLPACDYKRLGDGDTGPNTGGMGAYAPVPAVDAALQQEIVERIIQPTVAEMRRRGIMYRGVLYAGLMLTADGPKVLEFNCRMGDPETQVILPLLDGDLAALFDGIARGRLSDVPAPRWHDGAAVGVVLASGGYPGKYATGYPIHGLDTLPEDVIAFHAGTAFGDDGSVVTAGGRVLTLVARGADIAGARQRVYAAVPGVKFTNMVYRQDIALRETQPRAAARG